MQICPKGHRELPLPENVLAGLVLNRDWHRMSWESPHKHTDTCHAGPNTVSRMPQTIIARCVYGSHGHFDCIRLCQASLQVSTYSHKCVHVPLSFLQVAVGGPCCVCCQHSQRCGSTQYCNTYTCSLIAGTQSSHS